MSEVRQEGKKKGIEDAARDQQKQVLVDKQKIEGLVEQSNRVIYRLSTVFPFVLFPTSIVINENKIDIVNKLFFGSAQVISFFTINIRHVWVTTSIFFATIQFELATMEKIPDPIIYLKKKEALRAKNIIDGLVAMKRENVDLSNFSIEEVMRKAEEIGTATQPAT